MKMKSKIVFQKVYGKIRFCKVYTYSLSNNIRNNIFNYKNTVQNNNTNDTRTYGTGIDSCNCINSKYLNHYHGHIITRNLRVIEYKNICKIISEGLNYNEPKTINWKKI